MKNITLRKIVTVKEEIFHEGGPPSETPHYRGAIAAAIKNPFAGRYEPDIQWFMEDLKPLGRQLAERLASLLGGPDKIEGYGKGAMIGEGGELEHGALWHAPGGYAMRDVLGEALAIVPSTKKVAGIGGHIDIPITHINASYVRSHFDAMEVTIGDGPRSDEMVLILVMTTGPRIHSRSGGLESSQIQKKDGLR